MSVQNAGKPFGSWCSAQDDGTPLPQTPKIVGRGLGVGRRLAAPSLRTPPLLSAV